MAVRRRSVTEESTSRAKEHTKRFFRQAVLKKRDALSPAEQERARILITERLLGHQWYYNSDIILCYMSYGSELCTHELIEESLKKGKRVYLPRVEGKDMVFYRIHSLEELVPGFHGIAEPKGDTERYVYSQEQAGHTLIIMPGVAFDPYRNRMGYGGGYYDRFLRDKQGLWIRSIAICHKCQMLPEIPWEPHDIKPYQVIGV